MKSRRKWIIVSSLVVLTASVVLAQRRGFRGPSTDRGEVPEWSNEAGFEKDVFTFARIQYDSGPRRAWLGS